MRTLVLVGKNAKVQVLEKLEVSSGHASAVTGLCLGLVPMDPRAFGKGGKGCRRLFKGCIQNEKDLPAARPCVASRWLIKAEAAPVIAGPGGNSKGLGMAFRTTPRWLTLE